MREDTYNTKIAIGFSASPSRLTRAAVLDNNNIAYDGSCFGVYAYYTAQEPWDSFVYSTDELGGFLFTTPNFMDNQPLTYTASQEAWRYSPLKYWSEIEGDLTTFFAYYPYDAALPAVASRTYPAVDFEQSLDPMAMIDLLAASNIDTPKLTEDVVFDFQHVLTRLTFHAQVGPDLAIGDGSTSVYVTGLKILGTDDVSDSRLLSHATFVMNDTDEVGAWDFEHSTVAAASAMDLAPLMPLESQTYNVYTKDVVVVPSSSFNATSAIALFDPSEYIFLIPPYGLSGVASDTDIRLHLDYDIVTVDDGAPLGTTVYSGAAELAMPNGTLKQGIAYDVTFTVSQVGVEISTTSKDWNFDSSEEEDEE